MIKQTLQRQGLEVIKMAKRITQMKISLPKDLSEITEDNFLKYLAWGKTVKNINKHIIEPFKAAVYAKTGYSDENRPDKKVKDKVNVSEGIDFLVDTKPTTKRPSYKKVNEEFGNYVHFLAEQYGMDIRRKDIRTIDGEPYVKIDDLLAKINSELAESREGREGIEQSMTPAKPGELSGRIPESVTIAFGRDYSDLTENNARTYADVTNFLTTGNNRMNAFKKKILEDSLETLGGDPEEPTALSYEFENLDFVHQLEPRKSPKHKDVVYAFIKEAPENITKRTRIGDLVKVEMLMNGDRDMLEEKGLVDDEFIETYKPVRRADAAYVRLEGVKERLEHYRDATAKPTVEQNVYMLPLG
jgi:hypothetical protein